ncbi:MAG: acylneuraminate cytidylyltransferase family protein [Candidatus Portnoybacteria bacterium]|nr:acylneuraminate cytidylyltransferase family protein [Candidatus Portnoybacteria bacterium]
MAYKPYLKKNSVLVVIPARGGSKGVPGKNIKKLAGKPLIYYSIDAARQVAYDECICVSTDDDAISKAVERYGLKVPFKRPSRLATDTAESYDVLLHALQFYEARGHTFHCIILLQPTSPFRSAAHIKEALTLYSHDIDMVISVKETKANPYYVLFEENAAGFLEKLKPGNYSRRQGIPPVFELNGAVYILNPLSLKKSASLNEFTKIKKYVMDDFSSVDIDTPLDWTLCELIIKKNLIRV